MKPLLFAVFLAVVQTPPPVPHKATDSPANTPHNSRSQVSPNKPTAPASNPLPPANVINSINNENSGDTVRSKDQPETVRITELPPVTLIRDWADWVLRGLNALLVFAGFVGIWYARKTLKNIEEQTVITRKAADAAKESADVARDTLHLTQAADVHIEEIRLVPNGVLSGDTVISVVLKNHGQARAEQFAADLSVGIKGRGPALPERGMSLIIGAGQIFSVRYAPLRSGISTEDLAMILAGQLSLKIWGLLKYRDIFGKCYVIDCECTFSPAVGNFLIDRYEHRQEETQAN
jgi:hypothetical protein